MTLGEGAGRAPCVFSKMTLGEGFQRIYQHMNFDV
jgi:hypothetical protein